MCRQTRSTYSDFVIAASLASSTDPRRQYLSSCFGASTCACGSSFAVVHVEGPNGRLYSVPIVADRGSEREE